MPLEKGSVASVSRGSRSGLGRVISERGFSSDSNGSLPLQCSRIVNTLRSSGKPSRLIPLSSCRLSRAPPRRRSRAGSGPRVRDKKDSLASALRPPSSPRGKLRRIPNYSAGRYQFGHRALFPCDEALRCLLNQFPVFRKGYTPRRIARSIDQRSLLTANRHEASTTSWRNLPSGSSYSRVRLVLASIVMRIARRV